MDPTGNSTATIRPITAPEISSWIWPEVTRRSKARAPKGLQVWDRFRIYSVVTASGCTTADPGVTGDLFGPSLQHFGPTVNTSEMTGWPQHAVCYRCTKSDPSQLFKQSNDLKSESKMIHIKNTVCEYYILKVWYICGCMRKNSQQHTKQSITQRSAEINVTATNPANSLCFCVGAQTFLCSCELLNTKRKLQEICF